MSLRAACRGTVSDLSADAATPTRQRCAAAPAVPTASSAASGREGRSKLRREARVDRGSFHNRNTIPRIRRRAEIPHFDLSEIYGDPIEFEGAESFEF